jgi:hypothetical protein
VAKTKNEEFGHQLHRAVERRRRRRRRKKKKKKKKKLLHWVQMWL